jgi:pimeloyl-ACP methyl ester carboxylesterase
MPVDVNYEVRGSGPPLVLISGLSQPAARWHRVVPLLVDDFEVVTLDNRETGRTGPSPTEFALADCAWDVLDLMTDLGHERFFLAAASMGGMIGQELMAAAPDRVRAAVLMATHGGTPAAVPGDLDPIMPRGDTPEEIARNLWAALSAPGFAEAHPDVIEEEVRISLDQPTPVEGFMRQVQAIVAYDMGDRLVGTPVPVVVVHGRQDPLIPYENGACLAQQLRAELVTLEDTGHCVEFERPEEVVSILRRAFCGAEVAPGSEFRAAEPRG